MTEIIVTPNAEEDLAALPEEVFDTFMSKKESAEKNMDIGAEPVQAIGKYLQGNMHPFLQMNIGRDYRAWFIEGEYLDGLEDRNIYCLKIMKKRDAKKLTGQIRNALEYAGHVL